MGSQEGHSVVMPVIFQAPALAAAAAATPAAAGWGRPKVDRANPFFAACATVVIDAWLRGQGGESLGGLPADRKDHSPEPITCTPPGLWRALALFHAADPYAVRGINAPALRAPPLPLDPAFFIECEQVRLDNGIYVDLVHALAHAADTAMVRARGRAAAPLPA